MQKRIQFERLERDKDKDKRWTVAGVVVSPAQFRGDDSLAPAFICVKPDTHRFYGQAISRLVKGQQFATVDLRLDVDDLVVQDDCHEHTGGRVYESSSTELIFVEYFLPVDVLRILPDVVDVSPTRKMPLDIETSEADYLAKVKSQATYRELAAVTRSYAALQMIRRGPRSWKPPTYRNGFERISKEQTPELWKDGTLRRPTRIPLEAMDEDETTTAGFAECNAAVTKVLHDSTYDGFVARDAQGWPTSDDKAGSLLIVDQCSHEGQLSLVDATSTGLVSDLVETYEDALNCARLVTQFDVTGGALHRQFHMIVTILAPTAFWSHLFQPIKEGLTWTEVNPTKEAQQVKRKHELLKILRRAFFTGATDGVHFVDRGAPLLARRRRGGVPQLAQIRGEALLGRRRRRHAHAARVAHVAHVARLAAAEGRADRPAGVERVVVGRAVIDRERSTAGGDRRRRWRNGRRKTARSPGQL